MVMNTPTVLKVAGALLLAGVLVGCSPKKAAPAKPSAATEQALAKAEQCISQTQQLGVAVDQARTLLDQAKQAAQVPNDKKAQSLANQVCQQTDATTNAYYLGKARKLDTQAKQYTNLNASEQAQMQQGESGIANNNGKHAYDTLNSLVSQLQSARITYTVEPGDSLWNIAAKSSVYGNAYAWPLIYLYNSTKIADPDLIYPNQQFSVPAHPTKAELASAVRYAKTRGPWKNGRALPGDHAWLASQQSTMNRSVGSGSSG